MKILAIDIETAPSLAYVWGLFDQNIGVNQLVEPTEMLCFAAKWFGDRRMFFHSVQKDGREGMVRAAHELLNEADVVVHYNGKRFDVPHLNREFLQAGLPPPSPFVQMDLWAAVKRRFRFTSSKLEHVSTALGLPGKVKHEGFDLWRKCLAGDVAAWRRMERYNRQDVKLLEDLYAKLQPWLPAHPSRQLYDGISGCPTCGAGSLQRRGVAFTKVSKFQRWHCESCGGWFRSTRRDSGVDVQEAVL
jgi:RNase_H superfamily